MSAAPAEEPCDPSRAHPDSGPRTLTQLRAALTAASPADREEFEAQLGELDLDDPETYTTLVRLWLHHLLTRTYAGRDYRQPPAARSVPDGASVWSVVYSNTGRAALALATPEARAAVVTFEARLAESPRDVDELGQDPLTGLFTAPLRCGGHVVYRIDEAHRMVLIAALELHP
ncbi:hypothetical protein ACIQUU_24435 [Streptomyces sp. NPDC101116]|uniref:hypothetical protein n=1 Tax=Streptomyces sp. NPDC101116 TaxID=3366107 RepID=UPI0037F81EAE